MLASDENATFLAAGVQRAYAQAMRDMDELRVERDSLQDAVSRVAALCGPNHLVAVDKTVLALDILAALNPDPAPEGSRP